MRYVRIGNENWKKPFHDNRKMFVNANVMKATGEAIIKIVNSEGEPPRRVDKAVTILRSNKITAANAGGRLQFRFAVHVLRPGVAEFYR
jgi:hypothetical protein